MILKLIIGILVGLLFIIGMIVGSARLMCGTLFIMIGMLAYEFIFIKRTLGIQT